MIILTGDTHGNFSRIIEFCEKQETTKDDVMVILGDAGINFGLNERDIRIKELLAKQDITLFCVHGNHEERPENIAGYQLKDWRGGKVYFEEAYPNVLFAKDGELYDFDGKSVIAIGGAYSIDKDYRLQVGAPWFESEQPSDETKQFVEQQLNEMGWKVDYVFSHTVPYTYMPREAFLPGFDQSKVDNSTERWLDEIEMKLEYEQWYAGHFHVSDWSWGRMHILFEDYIELK